jgi:hypothetical protein
VTDQLAALRVPFEKEQIGKLPKIVCGKCSDRKTQCDQHKKTTCKTCGAYIGKHMHIDFVGHAHVTERLLNVDPTWSWEPMAFSGNGLPLLDEKGGLWIRLTIAGVTRIGYGDGSGPEAVKIAISDAIKNAAMRFGVALDLWKKEPVDPVADPPERQVARKAPADRAAELRGQIALLGKAKGKTVPEMGDDFAHWSQGKDITTASVAVLAEYLDHLKRGAE